MSVGSERVSMEPWGLQRMAPPALTVQRFNRSKAAMFGRDPISSRGRLGPGRKLILFVLE